VTNGDLRLGVGVAARLECDAELRLRDFHPSGHAGFQLQARVADGIVLSADLRMGLMHRGAEKLFEARDYRQIMMLANRHDWLSAFSSELGIALAIESATGITPPERATWTRTLLAEANRVAVAYAFLGAVLEDTAERGHVLALRERLVDAQERATGGRVHPMFNRIGGIAAALSPEVLAHFSSLFSELEQGRARIDAAVQEMADGLRGLAPLSSEDAVAFGVSGPVARASGLDLDLRRDDPYLSYAELGGRLVVPMRTAGDAAARYEVLAEQVPVSIDLMAACLARLAELGPGPVDVRLPKTVRVPEGVTHAWIEGPLGISGCLLASVGEKTPWRLKIRSASFNNVQAMGPALAGTRLADLPDAVMSYFFVVGDVDR
jgi:NADH-quinone oxidoreductase subunit D